MQINRETPNQILRFKGKWRKYQQRVLDRYAEYSRDKKFHIVAAPGSGKTTLGIELIRKVNRPTLILAPSITIREQWIGRICEAFLNNPDTKERYLSQNLKEPKLITVSTYQALHSAMTRYAGELTEANDEFKTVEQVDYSDFDVIGNFKQFGLGTLCLDECHHLRNEWWKALEEFKKSFFNIFTIALTATPPYDSTLSMWERYINVCGEIDEEITVPELVKEGTLCPHQDYVYFNYPTEKEEQQLSIFRKNARAAYEQLMNSKELADAVKHHRFFSCSADAHDAPENPEYLSSMLIFLNEKGAGIPGSCGRLLSYKKSESMNLKRMEILLQGFLYDDENSFPESDGLRAEIINELKSRGLIEKRKVMLAANRAVEKMLINSIGKCESIKTVTAHEYAGMGKELRLLILTDYIRKEYESALGDETRDVNSIGVLPLFEQIRRESAKNNSGLRLGVLCGTVVIIPAEAKEALLKLSDEPSKISFKKAGKLSDYVKVEIKGNSHFITGLISNLFADGFIHALIGTKSLLGEGWDSPCINSLILASFVGAYMLSNQMRGRAIRIYKQNPEKTSNIWHLVCVKPEDEAAGEYDEGAGEDYRTLCRRMENFMGVNYESDTIESGISRLTAVRLPFSPSNVETTNETMLTLSSQREGLKQRWRRSLALLQKMEIAEETQIREKDVPMAVFAEALKHLIIFILAGLFGAAVISLILLLLSRGALIIGMSLYFLIFGLCILIKAGKIHKFRNAAARLEAYGKGILKALAGAKLLELSGSSVKTESGNGKYSIYMRGGTGHDKTLFAKCVNEFFSAADDQRYLLYNGKQGNRSYGFFIVPEVFSKRKEDALLFAGCMKPYIGRYEAVYTKSERGRALLLRCRSHAAADKRECHTCKKARNASE